VGCGRQHPSSAAGAVGPQLSVVNPHRLTTHQPCVLAKSLALPKGRMAKAVGAAAAAAAAAAGSAAPLQSPVAPRDALFCMKPLTTSLISPSPPATKMASLPRSRASLAIRVASPAQRVRSTRSCQPAAVRSVWKGASSRAQLASARPPAPDAV